MNSENSKEMARILSERPELAPLLFTILNDPTMACESLALMISAEKNLENKKKLLNVKHAVERFALIKEGENP